MYCARTGERGKERKREKARLRENFSRGGEGEQYNDRKKKQSPLHPSMRTDKQFEYRDRFAQLKEAESQTELGLSENLDMMTTGVNVQAVKSLAVVDLTRNAFHLFAFLVFSRK